MGAQACNNRILRRLTLSARSLGRGGLKLRCGRRSFAKMPRYPIELQQPLAKASLVLISPYSCSFRFLLFCLLAPFPGPSLCFFGGLKRRGASGDPLEPPARACGPLIPPSFFRLFLRMDVVPRYQAANRFFFGYSLNLNLSKKSEYNKFCLSNLFFVLIKNLLSFFDIE